MPVSDTDMLEITPPREDPHGAEDRQREKQCLEDAGRRLQGQLDNLKETYTLIAEFKRRISAAFDDDSGDPDFDLHERTLRHLGNVEKEELDGLRNVADELAEGTRESCARYCQLEAEIALRLGPEKAAIELLKKWREFVAASSELEDQGKDGKR